MLLNNNLFWSQERIFTVAQLVRGIKLWLEYEYSPVWVEGEIVDLKEATSGNLFFILKDLKEDASIPAIVWSSYLKRIRFQLKEGVKVRCRGTLTIYEPRGKFQLIVDQIVEYGPGELWAQFFEIKERLEKEGLLDPQRKRKLPTLPKCIGIVTSLKGAAIHDMLKILMKAVPARIIISHASVQGENAPYELIRALDRLKDVKEIEVVIIGRGGGSKDELKAFNDEALARYVANFPVPVISAVGHEVDITIVDLVADKRAATPTEAASMVLPSKGEIESKLNNFLIRLKNSFRLYLNIYRNRVHSLNHKLSLFLNNMINLGVKLDELKERINKSLLFILNKYNRWFEYNYNKIVTLHPIRMVKQLENINNQLGMRLVYSIKRIVEAKKQKEFLLLNRLENSNPQRLIEKGYVIISSLWKKRIISSVKLLEVKELVEARFYDGLAVMEVKDIKKV